MKKQNRHPKSFLIAALILTVILVNGSGATSAFQQQVYGKIGEKWQQLGRERGPLGAAISSEANAPYGGCRCYWRATGEIV